MNAENALEGTSVAIPNPGDVVAEKYRIEALIGQGGMGAVLSATHLVTGKRVALKWLLPRRGPSADDLERFVREARAAGRIHHPGVVDIYDVGEHEGSLFLVMEHLEGRPLRAWLDRGPLHAGPLLATLLPALRGVQSAHARGVVHRDLKPENVFVCSGLEGEPLRAKILDFGISKLDAQREAGDGTLTASGVVLGTPHYMAPEQAEDSKAVDHRVDVYAFGVLLYEALAGKKPYEAQTLTAVLLQVARGRAEPIERYRPDLPRALARAVTRAMARDPGDRFRDVGELIAALEPFADPPSPTLTSLTPDGAAVDLGNAATERAVRRRALRKGLGLALLAALVGALIAVWRWSGGAQDAPTGSRPPATATRVEPSAATTSPTQPVAPKNSPSAPNPSLSAGTAVPADPTESAPAAATDARERQAEPIRRAPAGRTRAPTRRVAASTGPDAPEGGAAAPAEARRPGRLEVRMDANQF